MVDDGAPAVADAAEPGEDDPKRRKKEARLLADSVRGLDPWERYRALVDSLEEAMDLVELADRKARFALVIMGALNIAFFFLATRAEIVEYLPLWLRPFLGFYLLVYAARRPLLLPRGDRGAAAPALPPARALPRGGRPATTTRKACATTRTSCCATSRPTGARGATCASAS